MSQNPVFLAIDLGASSGRVMAGWIADERLHLEEVHRFPTTSTLLPSGYHWDLQHIFRSVLEGLQKSAERYGERIAGMAADTWGVDYGLLDKNDRLIGEPYQYRDPRGEEMEKQLVASIGRETIYRETGIQFMFFNTINQLAAENHEEPRRLQLAESLLFLPDLISFWLCGVKIQETSIASTSQLWNPQTRTWSEHLLREIGLPEKLFIPVTDPGTPLGPLTKTVRDITGLGPVPVIAVAGHDTGSAVAGTPLDARAPVFLSSGTWSIMGIESSEPYVNDEALGESFSNEAGVYQTTRFLKNICGMWLIEQLRDQWSREGNDYSYDNLLDMAREARPFTALIDPDDPRFATPGKMVDRIEAYCRETEQDVPATKGELVRVAFESLACKYRIVFEKLEALADADFPSLRIVGGGCQNAFLNQCTANALGRPVIAGPIEATSVGNLLLQMIATDQVADLPRGRELVDRSFESATFNPEEPDAWKEPVQRLKQLIQSQKI